VITSDDHPTPGGGTWVKTDCCEKESKPFKFKRKKISRQKI
jgi:hypothetical protein